MATTSPGRTATGAKPRKPVPVIIRALWFKDSKAKRMHCRVIIIFTLFLPDLGGKASQRLASNAESLVVFSEYIKFWKIARMREVEPLWIRRGVGTNGVSVASQYPRYLKKRLLGRSGMVHQ
ncbi:hypothetical protein HBI25_015840 [Parastagonospora nodorum]|nr:hypothetical protein HBH53_019470 [Parastagonospora nodorum]KAH3977102.1 hypothetical protein HBH52_113880 [Parastagonospora nodorum]KAH3999882.1 hypothetical protein HBI10_107880 [Parastagonospora nodorum]KAH4022337.1 hypothetical protein HBI13_101310 [Parastagonospora nodorum]KAH4027656.1 hypothetical protein HBI09_141510 [Parastagonospora nodorum]